MADAEAAGLAVESRFATFDLRPFDPDGDFAVFVLVALVAVVEAAHPQASRPT